MGKFTYLCIPQRDAGSQPAHRKRYNNMDKEIRNIDLTQWQQVGEGGNGKTYVNPSTPDVILKVNNSRLSTRQAVEREFNVSRAVKSLGISVPEAKEMVRVGNVYGTITQLIKPKQSLGRICCDTPGRTEEMASLLCARGKELFATPCDTSKPSHSASPTPPPASTAISRWATSSSPANSTIGSTSTASATATPCSTSATSTCSATSTPA